MADPFAAMTKMMGPAGGLINGLAQVGNMGSDKIIEGFKSSLSGIAKAIFEVIPTLLVELPFIILEEFPKALIKSFANLIKRLKEAFISSKQERERRREKAEEMGMKGPYKAFRVKQIEKMDERIEAIFDFFKLFKVDKKHTGTSHIDRTGAFLLQAGEAVIPKSGTTTQGMARRMGGGGGVNVTIQTNVVDQNSIRGLGKLLEQEFSSFGRSTSPLFNSPTGSRG
jgi:hypothetical protein